MDRNQSGTECKYRFEQVLVCRRYLKEVDHQKRSTIVRLERQKNKKKRQNYRRGLRSSFSSVNQYPNAAVIEKKSHLNLINVQSEILIADHDLVINEANDLIVNEDIDRVVDDDLIVNDGGLVVNADGDLLINKDDNNFIVDEDDLALNADDNVDEKQAVQVNYSNQEQESYLVPRHSLETQLKLGIALFIRQANMNKKDTNALLNLI